MSTVPIPNGYQDAAAIAPNARRRNDSSRGWVVQKFGGTSVGKFAVNIAESIVRYGTWGSRKSKCTEANWWQGESEGEQNRCGLFGAQYWEEGRRNHEPVSLTPPPLHPSTLLRRTQKARLTLSHAVY
jgi:hypothetical protein